MKRLWLLLAAWLLCLTLAACRREAPLDEVSPGETAPTQESVTEQTDAQGLRYVLMPNGRYRVEAGVLTVQEVHIAGSIDGKPVSKITAKGFSGQTGLKRLHIPPSVTDVGAEAFAGCTALEGVCITDLAAWCDIVFEDGGITTNPLSLSGALYLNGERLTALHIPEGVRNVRAHAFRHWRELRSVTLPASLVGVGENAFSDCARLVEVYDLSPLSIEKGSSAHGAVAQYALAVHTAADVPTSVFTDPNGYVFFDNGTERVLLTYTGTDTALTLPAACNGEPYGIWQYAFAERWKLTAVTLPDGVRAVGAYAFYGCTALQRLVLPASVTEIGEWAFGNCKGLADLTLSARITELLWGTFCGCDALVTLTLPDTVETVYSGSFDDCAALTGVAFAVTENWYRFPFGSSLGTAVSLSDPAFNLSLLRNPDLDCLRLRKEKAT